MRPVICIPVKPPAEGKSRLAPVLAPAARRRLVMAMLLDVLAACRALDPAVDCAVIGSGSPVRRAAAAAGAAFLPDPGLGLNAALVRAAAWAQAAGARQLLILPGDLPEVLPADLHRLLQAGAELPEPAAIIVPAGDGDGTNGLLLRPPGALAPHFGPGSCQAHAAAARAAGLYVRLLPLPSLAHDLDRPEDLERLRHLETFCGEHSRRFLARLRRPAPQPRHTP